MVYLTHFSVKFFDEFDALMRINEMLCVRWVILIIILVRYEIAAPQLFVCFCLFDRVNSLNLRLTHTLIRAYTRAHTCSRTYAQHIEYSVVLNHLRSS